MINKLLRRLGLTAPTVEDKCVIVRGGVVLPRLPGEKLVDYAKRVSRR